MELVKHYDTAKEIIEESRKSEVPNGVRSRIL